MKMWEVSENLNSIQVTLKENSKDLNSYFDKGFHNKSLLE